MVMKTWFHNLWRTYNRHDTAKFTTKAVIGVLSFEVASLMSKLIDLWQSLSDKQVTKLREEIMASLGIKKLITEDDDYIVQLICAELIYNLETVATAVARLGKRCSVANLNGLEHVFDDLVKVGADEYGLEFTWKKMESKVRKMERLITASSNLYQETEMLTELEQTLRRMSSCELDSKNLLEYQKKISWKRQEVRTLQDNSLWNKSYDYAISLLVRSIFTIFNRIKYVFGGDQIAEVGQSEHSGQNSGTIYSSNSLAALMQSSVHPSDHMAIPRFSSGPFWKGTSQSGPIWKTSKMYKSFSGPIGSPHVKSAQNFHSGPLAKTPAKSGPIYKRNIFGLKVWQSHPNTSTHKGKYLHSKQIQSTPIGASKGSMMNARSSSLVNGSLDPIGTDPETRNGARAKNTEPHTPDNSVHLGIFNLSSKRKLLNPPPETLGAAALALHYANIIIAIERLAASPHLIGRDARDDLYSMLPSSIRSALRARLRAFSKTLDSSVYDTVLADEWSKAMARILEWLAPLAHNMTRWQSERSYEQQSLGARTKVLLIQTLFYADREKTESVITELLVGLNYVWRFGREIEAKAFLACASTAKFEDYLSEDV